jgi:hypothetical protein
MSQAGVINVVTNNPAIPTSFVENVGTAVPVANILNIVGGAGITTSGAGNTVTITAVAMGFTWNVLTSATNPNSMVAENGYITKGAGSVVLVLPVAAAIGDTFIIVGYGNLWSLHQNALQSVFFGNMTTTVGAGGSITATGIKDTIELVCVTANTEFHVISSMGNPNIV